MGDICGHWEDHVLAREGGHHSASGAVLREWDLKLADHIVGQERGLSCMYWGNENCRCFIFLVLNADAPTNQSEEVSP